MTAWTFDLILPSQLHDGDTFEVKLHDDANPTCPVSKETLSDGESGYLFSSGDQLRFKTPERNFDSVEFSIQYGAKTPQTPFGLPNLMVMSKKDSCFWWPQGDQIDPGFVTLLETPDNFDGIFTFTIQLNITIRDKTTIHSHDPEMYVEPTPLQPESRYG